MKLEMIAILQKTGKHAEKIPLFEKKKESIKKGLERHAIVKNEKGERKIVHGWGDRLSHKVCSFEDCDKENRDGLTSNAFWVLSGALQWDSTLKEEILKAYDRLDSKYGLKTFEPYFPKTNTKVGRIMRLPKGTAENGATYIHATLFGILSLFEMGESKRAWEQIEKILPFTHESISTTPFIMSNSYLYNEERGFDGESMSDWFTGSGCVLIKAIVWEVFGVRPDLSGLKICPANYFPMKTASIRLRVRNTNLTIEYEKEGNGERQFTVNGEKREGIFDEEKKTLGIYFTDEELSHGDVFVKIRE